MQFVFLVVALTFLMTALGLSLRRHWPFIFGRLSRAEATVVDHARWRDYDAPSEHSYAPVLEFEDPSGTRHRVTDTVWHGAPWPSLRSRIAVVYPQGQPALARTRRCSLWELAALAFLATASGLVLYELVRLLTAH